MIRNKLRGWAAKQRERASVCLVRHQLGECARRLSMLKFSAARLGLCVVEADVRMSMRQVNGFNPLSWTTVRQTKSVGYVVFILVFSHCSRCSRHLTATICIRSANRQHGQVIREPEIFAYSIKSINRTNSVTSPLVRARARESGRTAGSVQSKTPTENLADY